MRTPIRIIGIATSAFWVFLIIFSASALYSMKDFQFNLGQPQISTTDDSELLFSFPVFAANTGFYNIAQFNISTVILNEEGSAIARGFTFVPILEHGQTINVTHNMRLNVTYLLQTHQSLLLNDSELTGNMRISMRAAEAVPVEASSNFSVPWGAPLYNLVLGVPQSTPVNTTHSQVIIPISFENHAFFDLTGTVQARAFRDASLLIDENQTDIYASQHSPSHGNLELYVPMEAVPRMRVEVFFFTQFFNYGPLVTPYGG
jgi:hypothetical protein